MLSWRRGWVVHIRKTPVLNCDILSPVSYPLCRHTASKPSFFPSLLIPNPTSVESRWDVRAPCSAVVVSPVSKPSILGFVCGARRQTRLALRAREGRRGLTLMNLTTGM